MTETPDYLLDDEQEQDLFEHHRLVADKGQSLLRIDKFLMCRLENVSRNKIQNAAKVGNILVNDKSVKQNYKVKPGDVISIVMSYPPREIEIISQDIPVKIVYEDEQVVVVDKAPGMVVHPGYGNYTGTLVNALTYHFNKDKKEDEEKVSTLLSHRIDKNTSGLILVAKDEYSQAKLAKQFYDHSIERKYYALVWGDFKEDEGIIEGHVGRSLKDRKVMDVFPNGEHGKHAITHYKVVERFGYVTLVECVLETGRTHQIRAHMQHIGHPLFNDETYGGDQILKGTTFTKYKQFIQNCFKLIPRQALHAATLGFIHPETGKFIRFEAQLPEDFTQVLDKWRNYVKFKELEIEDE